MERLLRNYEAKYLSSAYRKKKLVEAAGVEPASENVTSKENYMLSQFMLPAFTGNVRSTRSEQTRNADG